MGERKGHIQTSERQSAPFVQPILWLFDFFLKPYNTCNLNDVIPALTPINILSNDYFGDLCQTRISQWSFKDLIIYHSYSYVRQSANISSHYYYTIIQFRLNWSSFIGLFTRRLKCSFNSTAIVLLSTNIHSFQLNLSLFIPTIFTH